MITPLGARAWRFLLPAHVDRALLLQRLQALDDVVDVVLTEGLGAVVLSAAAPPARVLPSLGATLASLSPSSAAPTSTLHTIRVAYDGEDLPALAERLSLSPGALVALHADRTYDVSMIGFLPGFAYLRGLDPRLVLSRRDSPRVRVPPRSVAIAAEYTGIYPYASPGGWHLLGEALDFVPFDARGAALAEGDRVHFVPSAREAIAPPTPAFARAPIGAHLEVRSARGPAILVDGGRIGHMHEGVPHGGALVRGALARANGAVGNALDACAVEIYGGLDVVARGRCTVAADDGECRQLENGDVFTVATEGRGRARYLALQGGVDVPLVLGGRGTLLVARLGGLEGRPLKRGDRFAASSAAPAPGTPLAPPGEVGALTLLSGPDSSEEELDALLSATFTIAHASDRTGTRLDGPALPTRMHDARAHRSAPMVRGAVERTPSGLIVLGPDHPTTGGYPVIAVLAETSMDSFFGLPIGHSLRFTK